MRLHLSAAAVAAVVFALVAAPAFARTTKVPYQVNVTITNTACTLDHPVAPQSWVLFHVISNGTFSHQFKVWGVSSGIIKAGQEGRFEVKFRGAGKYPYSCYNSHAFLKRGVFRIR
jgi:plastocyanin